MLTVTCSTHSDNHIDIEEVITSGFFCSHLFTAEIEGTTTRAKYQEFGLDTDD